MLQLAESLTIKNSYLTLLTTYMFNLLVFSVSQLAGSLTLKNLSFIVFEKLTHMTCLTLMIFHTSKLNNITANWKSDTAYWIFDIQDFTFAWKFISQRSSTSKFDYKARLILSDIKSNTHKRVQLASLTHSLLTFLC